MEDAMFTRIPRIAACLTLIAALLSACGSRSAASPTAAPVNAQTGAPLQAAEIARRDQPLAPAEMPIAAPEPTSAPLTDGVVAAPAQTVAPAPTQAPAEPATDAQGIAEPLPAAPPLITTEQDRLSTFAMDVDTASYTIARGALLQGTLPPPNAVRVEEFVNFFNYQYPQPESGDFTISLAAAQSPFGRPGAHLLRVGIQGRSVNPEQRPAAMLTFVIDVSGSMQEPNRLPLVKQALTELLDQLRPDDQVGIVVYGSQARVLLEPASVSERERMLQAINALGDEGSTNAEAGLQLGYRLAADHFLVGGINRVILCSDGVANVGEVGPDAILASIRDYAAQGINLTTVGFGMDGYNDHLMEQLADDGDGNYAYVDTLKQAQRIFVENLTGTLQVIAKDAKVQVEFNPAVVSAYRLLGYENRAVADADFRNDSVDAGEVGAGHSVTAIYEVVLAEQAVGDALTVRLRYANPQTSEVREIERSLSDQGFETDLTQTTPRFQLAIAAAGFAEALRADPATRSVILDQAIMVAQQIAPQLPDDADVQELLDLMRRARQIG
jgi:Ca-activated chloride channel homolog